MIVVDATAWVDYLLGVLTEEHETTIIEQEVTSPAHVDFEVGSALLRKVRRDELARDDARSLIALFAAMPFERSRDKADAVRAVDLMNNATYADAWYLASAQRLGGALMTSDGGLADTAKIAGVDVIDTRAVEA